MLYCRTSSFVPNIPTVLTGFLISFLLGYIHKNMSLLLYRRLITPRRVCTCKSYSSLHSLMKEKDNKVYKEQYEYMKELKKTLDNQVNNIKSLK